MGERYRGREVKRRRRGEKETINSSISVWKSEGGGDVIRKGTAEEWTLGKVLQ